MTFEPLLYIGQNVSWNTSWELKTPLCQVISMQLPRARTLTPLSYPLWAPRRTARLMRPRPPVAGLCEMSGMTKPTGWCEMSVMTKPTELSIVRGRADNAHDCEGGWETTCSSATGTPV